MVIRTKEMIKDNSVVAIYLSHVGAEAAIKELQQSGFDMDETTRAKEILNRANPETLDHHSINEPAIIH